MAVGSAALSEAGKAFSISSSRSNRLRYPESSPSRCRSSSTETPSVPISAGFRVVPFLALTRFGKWDEMLKEPEPPAASAYLRGMWHYNRGLALLAKNQLPSAEQELSKLSNQ